MRVLKVKVISLPYIFQVLCFSKPRYQVSVHRTIGPLVSTLLCMLLLAHMSQRLIHVDELIVYPWSGARRSQCSNIFETTWPIKAKFYVEPPWVGGTKSCSRHVVT